MVFRRNAFAACLALPLSFAAFPAAAETTLTVQYAIPALFKATHEAIAESFMAANPDIKLEFRIPADGTAELATQALREALTNDLPDVAFHASAWIGALSERGLLVPLDDFIAQDKDWPTFGHIDSALAFGKVDGRQVGLTFAYSAPLLYYNLDLVKQAGGDPEKLPRDWDGIIDLAAKINGLGGGVSGIWNEYQQGPTFIWQTLVQSHGGDMVTADETKAAFDSEAGRKAIDVFARMATKGGMQDLAPAQGRQAFTAGTIGVMVGSSSWTANFEKQIDRKFAMRTVPFPMPSTTGKLPSTVYFANLTTKDAEKQAAAWRYIKFLVGPQGQSMMAKSTGYLPSNQIAIDSPELLAEFYKSHPNWGKALSEVPVLVPLYGYKGPNGLKVPTAIKDTLQGVLAGRVAPDAGLAEMIDKVNDLIGQK